jgi:hypothetical protein
MTGSKSGSANVAAHSGDVPPADQNPSGLRAGQTRTATRKVSRGDTRVIGRRAALPGAVCCDTVTASFAHPAMIGRLWMPA